VPRSSDIQTLRVLSQVTGFAVAVVRPGAPRCVWDVKKCSRTITRAGTMKLRAGYANFASIPVVPYARSAVKPSSGDAEDFSTSRLFGTQSLLLATDML
jgi:hypothetical protein